MGLHKKPKSFVLRQGRITQNQKEALDSLWNKFVIEDISEINQFLKDKHSVLDIGFGSGETLLHIAENKREVSVLGVEVYLSGIGAVLSKANELGLENIKIFNNDAEDLLRKNILPSSFDEIIMFYPDPWPKRKHHKRRLIKKDFIKVINSKLKPGGIFYFKSDWNDYAAEVNSLFKEDSNWISAKEDELDTHLRNIPPTSFEKKALLANRPLHKIIEKKIN